MALHTMIADEMNTGCREKQHLLLAVMKWLPEDQAAELKIQPNYQTKLIFLALKGKLLKPDDHNNKI